MPTVFITNAPRDLSPGFCYKSVSRSGLLQTPHSELSSRTHPALHSSAGMNPSLPPSRHTPLHLGASETIRPSYGRRLPSKLPAPISSRAKPGNLTRSAAPVTRLGDTSRPTPTPGPPSKARWSDPARGGREHRLWEPPYPKETGPGSGRAACLGAATSFPCLGLQRLRRTATTTRNPLVTHHLDSAA